MKNFSEPRGITFRKPVALYFTFFPLALHREFYDLLAVKMLMDAVQRLC